jgi:pimeloyl-ACP methyl ester carboxylesterase
MLSIIRFVVWIQFLISSISFVPIRDSASLQGFESILEEFGGEPCPDGSEFTCITLPMPLDHFNPEDERTIPVTFAVLQATGNRKGMFVTATGGPGTSGIAVADYYTSALDPGIPRHFDIVFFDQRGVALSGNLACPIAAVKYYRSDWRAETPEQEASVRQAARTFSRACVDEMGHPEILPYLGTRQAVEDLEAFRKLVKDEKFWLYGESYGTQYAQTYAAKHGDHLAGLILDGTVDLTLDGFEFYAQEAQAFNDTLVATLEVCMSDPACRMDLNGDAVAAYDKLVSLLERRSQEFQFPLPEGGFAHRRFTLADLEVAAAGQMYTEDDRMLFSRALAAFASRQDLAPLARLLYLSLGLDSQTLEVIQDFTYSDAVFYGVECQDYGYPGVTPAEKAENYLRAGDAVEAAVARLASIFYGDLPCAFWPGATTDMDRPDPLIAPGITTFVLGATADPATPVGNGISVYKHLDDGYLVTQQGGPHIIFGRGNECPDELITDFLLQGQVPQHREIYCEGLVADEYVPLAPKNAWAFENPLEALVSTETEMYYLPEFYYWDGVEATNSGCTYGGTFRFEPDDALYVFTLDKCAFTQNFIMTGTGSYDYEDDRFILEILTTGRWRCDLKYTRTGEETEIAGGCDARKVGSEN